MARVFIAGESVFNAAQAEREAVMAKCEVPFGHGRSEVLCRVQSQQAARGLTGAHIVRSMYGFSVRYDSGLQNFALLRAARGSSDPSLAAAIRFCADWVAQSPQHRYAYYNEEEAEGS